MPARITNHPSYDPAMHSRSHLQIQLSLHKTIPSHCLMRCLWRQRIRQSSSVQQIMDWITNSEQHWKVNQRRQCWACDCAGKGPGVKSMKDGMHNWSYTAARPLTLLLESIKVRVHVWLHCVITFPVCLQKGTCHSVLRRAVPRSVNFPSLV